MHSMSLLIAFASLLLLSSCASEGINIEKLEEDNVVLGRGDYGFILAKDLPGTWEILQVGNYKPTNPDSIVRFTILPFTLDETNCTIEEKNKSTALIFFAPDLVYGDDIEEKGRLYLIDGTWQKGDFSYVEALILRLSFTQNGKECNFHLTCPVVSNDSIKASADLGLNPLPFAPSEKGIVDAIFRKVK